jgi:hypothetical protein
MGLTEWKSNLVAEIVDFVGRRVRRAEAKPIWEGEKQELVGRRNVFSRGLSGRIAVETSGEASGRRFKSTEGDAAERAAKLKLRVCTESRSSGGVGASVCS